MDIITTFLNVLINSILGFYLFEQKNKNQPLRIITPFYGVFSLISLYTTEINIIWLYISGIIWAYFVNVSLSSIDKSLYVKIHLPLMGLLNIINFFILNPLVQKFIKNSSFLSLIILSSLGLIIVSSELIFVKKKEL